MREIDERIKKLEARISTYKNILSEFQQQRDMATDQAAYYQGEVDRIVSIIQDAALELSDIWAQGNRG